MNRMLRRLLSVMLAIVMVISGLQFGGWTQEAKAVTAGKTIYFDVNGDANFYNDDAVPVVLFKTGSGVNAGTVGDWTEMTYVKDDIYSAVVPEGATYVQFRRSNDTNSGSKEIELNDDYNYYQIKDSGWAFNSWDNDLNWYNRTVITPASYAGKTIYVTGNATVSLSDGTAVAGTQLTDETGNLINVYKYTFGTNVAEGTTFSITIDGTAYVSGASDVNSEAPCFDTDQNAWVAYTEPVTNVAIYLTYEGDSKPSVWFVKNGSYVSEMRNIDSFEFDLLSTEYDGFYVGWDGTGNQTDHIVLDEIRANIAGKTKVQLVIGGWNNGNNRTHTWSEAAFLGDTSLNIPEGTFEKESGSYYVSTTFYDYYSDVELTGVNRNTLTSNFETGDGSNDKIQARTFNEAVSSFFSGKLSGSFKPLYFGEFTNAPQSYYLYDFSYNNAAGGANGNGAHQGLIDSTLNGSDNATMNGIELPYFNKEFLRGDNSANQAIGQVFENVQFPFVKNAEGYWEFDSAKADQTLRMKYDSDMAAYYLDRVGTAGKVEAVDSFGNNTGSGFFPFNDSSESGNRKKLNYAFGVRFDIPFAMTADGKYGEEGNKQDIVYNFSGDDDVWVFIDGVLALDIGGDHGRVEGYINFATQKVSVTGSGEKTFADLGISVAANEQHTLTMFYMERGLWESNMKITFNFPQVNTFAVNMEVDTSGVDEKFISALEGSLSSFDVSVQNYATRGEDKSAGTESVVESHIYNSLNAGTESTVTYEGSPEQSGIQTDTNNKSGRNDVLLVKYKAQLNNTPDASGHRVTIKPEEGDTFDASEVSDYLQFDMYNEGLGSTGVPYVCLKDASGNVISGWANNSIAYDGNNNTLTRNKWVTVKVDLQKLKGNSSFDFENITEIQIGYWDSGYTFIDDITFHKKVTVEQEQTKFQTPQYEVPTYGSVGAGGLTNATGAIYEQQKGEDDSQFYMIGSDGTITMSDGDTALFTDQFRIGSYINLTESVDSDYYTTTWNLSEGNSIYKSGSGSVIDDERTEIAEYAAENDASGSLMNLNDGVTKPDNSLLYRSNARTDDVITPTNIEATFINTINTGSLNIKKELGENLTGGEYKFTITYSNIFGQIDKEVEETVTLNAGNGYSYTSTGIPVGTSYIIKEVIADDVNYTVTNITKEGNDSGSGDVTNKRYAGIISLGVTDLQDVITFTNDLIPEQVDKVFFVEAGTETTLPMDLEELRYFDEVADPESSEEADIYLERSTTADGDGSDVRFDAPYVNEYGETEPSKSVPNEKYTFTYSGKDNNGEDGTSRMVTGTVTVYTFKAYNDVYVLDYGLKTDLADTGYGNGLFQNDILFNEYVSGTAAFTGLKTAGDIFTASIDNEQSTVTGTIGTSLNQIGTTNGASLDGEEKVILQPKVFMDKVEVFYYQASVYAPENIEKTIASPADGVNLSASVKVMPATVVYYEDNFSSVITNGTAEGTPDADREQGNGLETQYGYDQAYQNDGTFSNNGYTALSGTDKFAFTFKGTGFDILTRTADADLKVSVYDADQYELKSYTYGEGKVFISAVKKADAPADAKVLKTVTVNASYENGTVDQIPLISVDLEKHGSYIVLAQRIGDGEEALKVDGIRIYNPLGTITDEEVADAYDKAEGEKGAKVREIRSMIFGEGYAFDYTNPADPSTAQITEGSGAVAGLVQMTGNQINIATGSTVVECYTGAMTSADIAAEKAENPVSTSSLLGYAVSGPNNELYLTGEAYAFAAVVNDIGDSSMLQIGLKAVEGTAAVQYRAADGEWKDIPDAGSLSASLEMYYRIPAADLWQSNGKTVLMVRAINGTASLTHLKYQDVTFEKITREAFGDVVAGDQNDSSFNIMSSGAAGTKAVLTFSVSDQVKDFTITNKNTGEKVFTYGTAEALPSGITVSRRAADGLTIYVVKMPKEAGTYTITTSTGESYGTAEFEIQE